MGCCWFQHCPPGGEEAHRPRGGAGVPPYRPTSSPPVTEWQIPHPRLHLSSE